MTVKTDPLNQVGGHHSDWSDDEDSEDNQARATIAKPMLQNPQPSKSSGTLRKPNTYPKVLTFGRGVMAPLSQWIHYGMWTQTWMQTQH